MLKKYLLLFIISITWSGNTFASAVYRWETSSRHSFCQNFPAGHEADGRKLYVSQIERKHRFIGITISFDENGNVYGPSPDIFSNGGSTWHIGKAGTHLKEGMAYSYGGKEYNVGHFNFPKGNKYHHFTLCLTSEGQKKLKEGGIKWVFTSDGNVPNGAVKGFNRKENQHVCRMSWGGGIHPGKLIAGHGCFIGYGGGEKVSKSYEVLVIQ